MPPPPCRFVHLLLAAVWGVGPALAFAAVAISAQGDGGFAGVKGGPGSIAFSRRVNSDITADGKIKADAPPNQLYNLEADPMQSTNVVRQYPEIAARLARQLEEYRASTRTAPARQR
ncbi:MAG: hypothetical protein Q7S40_02780 [Opitutaceae bacterium]|nr:hypothetical protein [Opitutaceae bacterium]